MVIQIRSKHFHDSLKIALILAPGRGFLWNKIKWTKIYGMKLKEAHFSSGTVITQFLDKAYQEIHFKGHSNSVPLWK